MNEIFPYSRFFPATLLLHGAVGVSKFSILANQNEATILRHVCLSRLGYDGSSRKVMKVLIGAVVSCSCCYFPVKCALCCVASSLSKILVGVLLPTGGIHYEKHMLHYKLLCNVTEEKPKASLYL